MKDAQHEQIVRDIGRIYAHIMKNDTPFPSDKEREYCLILMAYFYDVLDWSRRSLNIDDNTVVPISEQEVSNIGDIEKKLELFLFN